MERKLDYKQALYLSVGTPLVNATEGKATLSIRIIDAVPYASEVFPIAERSFMNLLKLTRGRSPHSPESADNGIPDFSHVVDIPTFPIETLEARSRAYFEKWAPGLFRVFEEIYDYHVVPLRAVNDLGKKLRGEGKELERRLRTDAEKGEELAKIKGKSEETSEGMATFYRIMKNALSRLPDAQGVGFEVLTPQMWLDNDHATGIYARPPKDTIYVAASSYWTGKVRPVEAWLDDLAHEAAHRPKPNGHDVEFVLREQRNREILRKLSIDELVA